MLVVTTWVPLCPECRVPVRGGPELHEPPAVADETPTGSMECLFCGAAVSVDDSTKWARVA